MVDFTPYLERARVELMQRSRAEIETETAYTWTGRAVAAVEYGQGSVHCKAQWGVAAIVFGHEAIEHAGSALPGVKEHIEALLEQACPALFGKDSL